MTKQLLPYLLTVFISMFRLNAFAYDIEVKNADGVTIYYNWINNKTELEVTSLYGYDGGGYSGNVVIPESVEYGGKIYKVTSIGQRAFMDCSVTSVIIPNGVTSIGMNAFDCCSLSSITIPSSIAYIDEDAFRVSVLTSVHIFDLSAWCKIYFSFGGEATSSNPLSYADHLYLNGKEIKDLVIPDGVTSISDYAFVGCSCFTSVIIPNSVTSIGKYAFDYCKGLTTITSEIEKPFEIDSYTFDSDTYNVAELIVPKGTKAAYQATEGWNKFTKITEATSGVFNPINTPTDYVDQYLTFVARESGTFKFKGTGFSVVSYSLDSGATWNTLADNTDTPTVQSGQKIMWKGNLGPTTDGSGIFSSSGNFDVEGNIMSLLYGDDFRGQTTVGGDCTFKELFSGCTTLQNAKNLVLIATQLADFCYHGMFRGCTSLTTAPELPATRLREECYNGMFSGCTSLTVAPNLPATRMADFCYGSMFANCTSLTIAPSLPATTLAGNCYYGMFYGCTSLTTAPELPATILVDWCYDGMFAGCGKINYIKCLASDISASYCTRDWLRGVSSSGTFVKNSSMSGWTRGENGIPSGWTIQNDSSLPKDQVYKVDGIYYKVGENNTVSVTTGEIKYSGDVVIPEFVEFGGKMYIVTSIDWGAFSSCDGLTSITIPNSVTTIGGSAFSGCSGLTSITIPNSITSIGSFAFYGCSGLTTITSEIEKPFEIDAYTFNPDTYNVAELIVPKGTKTAYQSTAGWNKFQNIVEASGGEEPIINPSTDYSDQYLTFKTSFHRRYTFNGTTGNDFIQYARKDDGYIWRTLARGESVWVEGGDEIRWKGNLTPNPYYGIGNFVDDDEPFEVCGNIMSLIYGDDFIGKTSLDGKEDAFRDLFSGCADLVSAKGLVLPATTLADRCYYRMFINCTSLTTAPALPATTMSYGCYCSMFENCKSLTTAPVLPATTLAESCYSNMFDGCRRLTTAPDLPATKLANGCYNSMFAGCSSINHVKCLATDLGANSTTGWLYGVSSSGTFVKSSSMNDWARGESGIPKGWTIQNDNESSSEKYEVSFAIDGITYQGTKSEKTVFVKAVDTSRTWIEIPASVSYDGMTYQVTGIADGVFDGSSMAALIWDVEAALPNNAFGNASIGSNFLLYVKSSSYAPLSVKNVVVDGTAQTIVLSDDGGQFYCPQAFTARRISYSHNYSMETGKGSTMGWESIALPFDVQRIIHSIQGEIVPFAAYSSGSNQKPFWLAYMSASGFKRTADIRANEAYIIAMPNNSSYQDNYILAGDVTFSAENITVPKTPMFNGTFLPAFSFVSKSSSVYALNVNNRYVRYSGSEKPGSIFIRDLRDVRPFEAYLTGNFTRGIIEINYDNSTTDILDVLLSTDDSQEMTIHTLSGQQVTRTTQRDFDSVWQQLPKGVYIVSGKKLIK